MSLDTIQPLLPLVFSIAMGILGYLFGVRTRKIDRFFGQVQENLSKVSSPLFHDIRAIERQVRPCDRDRLLKNFFNKYGATETTIYKIGNRYIWERYYQLEDKYYAFSSNRTQENWNDFWIDFDQFSSWVKTEYKLNTLVMFREYDWMRFIWGKGFLSRLFREFSRIFYETSKTLSFASLFLIYIIFWDRLFGHGIIPKEIISLCFSVISLIFPLWGLSMMFASKYITSTTMTLEKSMIQLFFERKFPKAFQFWDKKLRGQSQSAVKKVKIPEI